MTTRSGIPAAILELDRLAPDEQPRFGTTNRRKGKRLLTQAEKRAKRRAQCARWRAKNRAKLREYFRKYREANPELKGYYAAYYRANKEKWAQRSKSVAAKERQRTHRSKNRDRLNAQRRAWDARNPDRAKAIAARSRAGRREAKRLADRIYRETKPAVYAESIRRAKAKKPELYKASAAERALRRRVRLKGNHTEPVSRRRIIARDRDICHLCGVSIEPQERTIDHLIPIVRGGAHAEWNLMQAHDRCNKRRGTRQILAEETKEAALAYIAEKTADGSERAA